MPDDISISILTITTRHSLLLTSCSRTAIGKSYDILSLLRELYGVTTFRFINGGGLGSFSSPAIVLSVNVGVQNPILLIAVPFLVEA